MYTKMFFSKDCFLFATMALFWSNNMELVECNYSNCLLLTRIHQGFVLTEYDKVHATSNIMDCAEKCYHNRLCTTMGFHETGHGTAQCRLSYVKASEAEISKYTPEATVYTVGRKCQDPGDCWTASTDVVTMAPSNDDVPTVNTATCVPPKPDVTVQQICLPTQQPVYVVSALRAQAGRLIMFTDNNLMLTCLNFGVIYNYESISDPFKCKGLQIMPGEGPINSHGGFNDGPPTMATGWIDSDSQYTFYYLFRDSKVYMYRHSDSDVMSYIGMSSQESNLPLDGAVLSTWAIETQENPIFYMLNDDWVTKVHLQNSNTYQVILSDAPEPIDDYVDEDEYWFGTNLTRVMCGIQAIAEDQNERSYLFFKDYDVYYLGHKQNNPTEGPLTQLGNICL